MKKFKINYGLVLVLNHLNVDFMNFNKYIECMQHKSFIDYIVWQIQFQIALASRSTPRTCGYIAPKFLSTSKMSISKPRHMSPKNGVYGFEVLMIQLVNGSLEDEVFHIHGFIKWAKTVHVQKNGFQDIFNVRIDNSIVGFDHNQDKLLLQIPLGCIQIIFVPNLLFLSLNLWSNKFQKPKIMDYEIHETI